MLFPSLPLADEACCHIQIAGEDSLTGPLAQAGFNVNAVAIFGSANRQRQQAVDVSAGAVLWPAPGWDGHGRFVGYSTASRGSAAAGTTPFPFRGNVDARRMSYPVIGQMRDG